MNRYPIELGGLTPSDAEYLGRVQLALPLVADLYHSDLLLFISGNQPNTAVVLAQASPHTASSVFAAPLVGRQFGKKNEPLVFHAFKRGQLARGFQASPPREARTAQFAHPLKGDDGSVIAVLSVEATAVDVERLKRKSRVYRKALSVILSMAKSGQLHLVEPLTPVGAQDGLVVVDGVGQIQYMSSSAEGLYRKLGYPGLLLGAKVSDIHGAGDIFLEAVEQGRCIERETGQRDLVWIKKAIPLLSDESTPWLDYHRGLESRFGGVLIIINDVTEQRQKEQALKIKSAMIQEIHHRVKNNLQTIAALLRLQARRATSPEVETMLSSSINRILSIAVVHEFLSHDQDSVINIREVCQRILNEVTHGILDPDKDIALRLEGTNLYLPAQQATSCALIVNELLQNAVKHGYPGRNKGTVVVRFLQQGEDLTVEITDDGVGLPETFESGESTHLGLQIISTLVKEDLKGQFELANGQGVTARITFPRLAATPREVATMAEKL